MDGVRLARVEALAKGRQIRLADTQEAPIAHGRERPLANPDLDGALGNMQDLGDVSGAIEWPDTGRGLGHSGVGSIHRYSPWVGVATRDVPLYDYTKKPLAAL